MKAAFKINIANHLRLLSQEGAFFSVVLYEFSKSEWNLNLQMISTGVFSLSLIMSILTINKKVQFMMILASIKCILMHVYLEVTNNNSSLILISYCFQIEPLSKVLFAITYSCVFTQEMIQKGTSSECSGPPTFCLLIIFITNVLTTSVSTLLERSQQTTQEKYTFKDSIRKFEFQADEDSNLNKRDTPIIFKQPSFQLDLSSTRTPTFPDWMDLQRYLILDYDLNLRKDNAHLSRDLYENFTQPNKSEEYLLKLFLSSTSSTLSKNLQILLNDSKHSMDLQESLSKTSHEKSNVSKSFDLRFIIQRTLNATLQTQLFSVFEVDSQHFDMSNKVINFYHDKIGVVLWFQESAKKHDAIPNMRVGKSSRTSISSKLNESFSQQLISNIFSSVSHEFGTYLNCIMSLSSLGVDDLAVSKKIKDQYLDPICQNSLLLNFILNNMRDFNQILLNQFTLKIEEFRIDEEINTLLEALKMPIKSRGNRVLMNVNTSSDTPIIMNDLDRFRQVVYQLLSNAIRFTQNGQITIDISTEVFRFREYIRISVTDTGIGMTNNEASKLRELFRDGRRMIKVSTNSVGCGLGLNISNLICQKLSGQVAKGINFKSEPNKMTKFSFLLYNFTGSNESVHGGDSSFVRRFNSYYYRYDSMTSQSHYYEGSVIKTQTVQNTFKNSELRTRNLTENQFNSRDMDHMQFKEKGSPQISGYSRVNSSKLFSSYLQDDDPTDNSPLTFPLFKAKMQDEVLKFDWKGSCCSRVLIIDDEYFNILSLTTILKRYRTKTDHAFHGQQALEMVNTKQKQPCKTCNNSGYSVYFIDINMPIMDGYETVRQLKLKMKMGLLQKGVCIANTGFVDLQTKDRCQQEGFDQYISKPIRIKELEQYLSSIFK